MAIFGAICAVILLGMVAGVALAAGGHIASTILHQTLGLLLLVGMFCGVFVYIAVGTKILS